MIIQKRAKVQKNPNIHKFFNKNFHTSVCHLLATLTCSLHYTSLPLSLSLHYYSTISLMGARYLLRV